MFKKRRYTVLLLLIVSLWIPLRANSVEGQTGVIELQPTEDAYIVGMAEVYKLYVHGDLEYLRVCDKVGGIEEEETGSVHPWKLMISFLKFDLSSVPRDAKVASAELKINVYDLEEPYRVGVYRCLNTSWRETDAEWLLLPPMDPEPTTVVMDKTGWQSLDVKTAVIKALPARELALAVKIEDHYPTRGFWFWSRTASPDVRPKLIIALKTLTSITCSGSSQSVKIGEQLTVRGTLSGVEGPLPSAATIVLTYVRPDGTRVERTVTATEGEYVDSYAPDVAGSWGVSAAWAGDVLHDGSVSPTFSFLVEERPILERYSVQLGVLIVAAVLIVLASLVVRRRRVPGEKT